jgi:hypothetical protein
VRARPPSAGRGSRCSRRCSGAWAAASATTACTAAGPGARSPRMRRDSNTRASGGKRSARRAKSAARAGMSGARPASRAAISGCSAAGTNSLAMSCVTVPRGPRHPRVRLPAPPLQTGGNAPMPQGDWGKGGGGTQQQPSPPRPPLSTHRLKDMRCSFSSGVGQEFWWHAPPLKDRTHDSVRDLAQFRREESQGFAAGTICKPSDDTRPARSHDLLRPTLQDKGACRLQRWQCGGPVRSGLRGVRPQRCRAHGGTQGRG